MVRCLYCGREMVKKGKLFVCEYCGQEVKITNHPDVEKLIVSD